jgi:hypothetical protein
MSKTTSILTLGRKHTEGQRADFVYPLVWKGPQPSDGMAPLHLTATVAFVAKLSGAQHPDKMTTALIVGLKCLPLEVG